MVEKSAPRREVQVDLSGLTQRQIFLREQVIMLGEMAFGARWQSVFAAELSQHAGRPVRQAQVSHWISGYRPVPEAMVEPLRDLALRVAAEMARRVDEIRARWAPPPVPSQDADALDPLYP
ncbi:hypothetical protein [Methylobacterium ajmalii]|jgi:hypothetical protein|uniref:hypothetical protein n=1 Tax=Methylobacterium ajmalii TaxID=2738439 RepID=UPI00190BF8CB|nr:hypothetical protein [Methylobacterium ajmalii]MBK3400858.1 hypothetical protein [Methylobacterium ajmalii]MBK3410933.1 hypothetical protein [Methylobacterium ajmalii]MBK3421904.1 hypothetical protein [Methylobacterium ajmalii]MBZ6415703.1 hypothetical protein [Methylobacterium sp.]